jgi:hypothetical protein
MKPKPPPYPKPPRPPSEPPRPQPFLTRAIIPDDTWIAVTRRLRRDRLLADVQRACIVAAVSAASIFIISWVAGALR